MLVWWVPTWRVAASGTVTLQTALAGVPGVACYRTSALSALIGRWLVQMDRVILPNALLQREVDVVAG